MPPVAAPLSISRYELKYTIPHTLIGPIADFVSVYCSLDRYSAMTPERCYTVNSLYFDSPGLLLLRMRQSRCERRFNVRVRSYGDEPRGPFFLEVKDRYGEVIRKRRARVYGGDLERIAAGAAARVDGVPAEDRAPFTAFTRLVTAYNLSPQVLTQYRRTAYVSAHEEYARVTFDTRLCSTPRRDYDVRPGGEALIPYDGAELFDPGCDTVLELKCLTSHVPLWMVDLVRAFNLRHRGFSKYAGAMAAQMAECGGLEPDRIGVRA